MWFPKHWLALPCRALGPWFSDLRMDPIEAFGRAKGKHTRGPFLSAGSREGAACMFDGSP